MFLIFQNAFYRLFQLFAELFKPCIPPECEVDPGVIQDEDEADDEDDDEVSQDDQGRILENCYLGMVDALAKQVLLKSVNAKTILFSCIDIDITIL